MKYSEKRRRRLVPFAYDTTSKPFHQGAWKNWPAGMSDSSRSDIARREAPSIYIDRGYHRFTLHHSHKAVEFQTTY